METRATSSPGSAPASPPLTEKHFHSRFYRFKHKPESKNMHFVRRLEDYMLGLKEVGGLNEWIKQTEYNVLVSEFAVRGFCCLWTEPD